MGRSLPLPPATSKRRSHMHPSIRTSKIKSPSSSCTLFLAATAAGELAARANTLAVELDPEVEVASPLPPPPTAPARADEKSCSMASSAALISSSTSASSAQWGR
jgi:hypothetical protein